MCGTVEGVLSLVPPIFERLSRARRVLLVGMGGGYDVFSGLPLLFALRAAGKSVVLANVSFSSLDVTSARRVDGALFEVRADTRGDLRYFPEGHLAKWLAQTEPQSVFAVPRTGVRPMLGALRHLVRTFDVDTLLLVDGGTDSLMRGDEAGLGTPEEDAVSLAAAQLLEGVDQKLLVCLGFGVDTFHGVPHAQVLERVADLTMRGAYLGAWSLTPDMPEVRRFREALDFVHARMPDFPSIVSTSVLDAIDGRFGDFHGTSSTRGSELFINPLMGLYWAFDANGVAGRNLYLDRLRDTDSIEEVRAIIEAFRAALPQVRAWTSIPL